MNQVSQCSKEMQCFETNFWSANLNWKGQHLFQPVADSGDSLSVVPSHFRAPHKLRFSRYSLISFYLNPENDRLLNHFLKGQDARNVGRWGI